MPHGVGCEYPKYPTGVPPRCSVLTAHWGNAGCHWWAPARARAACGVQVNDYGGGLVGISDGGSTGYVSVIGSTLTNITVRAYCLSTL